MQMHYQTAPNIKYGVILPVVISWYLSKIYQIVYFDLLKNMLGKLNPFAFFLFCYTIRELWRKKKINLWSNLWQNLKGQVISEYKNENLEMISLKNFA